MFGHIIIRYAAPQIHQTLLAAVHDAARPVENPQRGIVENVEHLVAAAHVRRRHHPAEQLPGDTLAARPYQFAGNPGTARDVGRERIGTPPGERFVQTVRPVRRGVGTDFDALEPAGFVHFADATDEALQFASVLPETDIHFTVSPPVIDSRRVGGRLSMQFSGRKCSEQTSQQQFPQGRTR